MNYPLISIIVPIFNVEKYLTQCIDSIFAQTYTSFELILVNDGSKDNCGAICDDYAKKDSRIIVIHKKNGGVSSARNAGLDIAKGNYIGWVDADDYIAPDMYETLYNLITSHKADIAECNYVSVNGDQIVKCGFGKGLESGEGDFLLNKYLDEDIFHGLWTKLFKKKVFENIRFPGGRIFEDTWFSLFLAMQPYRYVRISVEKYFYRQSENSIVRSVLTKRKAREFIYLIERENQTIYQNAQNSIIRNKLLLHVSTKGVFWYLDLALSQNKNIREVYSKLYHNKMDFGIIDCITSNKIPARNKISYVMCMLHLNKVIIFLKHISR